MDLGRRLFGEMKRRLAENVLKVAPGTIVDATIISAPASTKECGQGAQPGDAPDEKRATSDTSA